MSKYVIGSIIISLLAIATFITGLSIRSDVKPKKQPLIQTNPQTIDKPEKTILATATNLPSPKQTVQGIDFSVESAQIYKTQGETLLELNLRQGRIQTRKSSPQPAHNQWRWRAMNPRPKIFPKTIYKLIPPFDGRKVWFFSLIPTEPLRNYSLSLFPPFSVSPDIDKKRCRLG